MPNSSVKQPNGEKRSNASHLLNDKIFAALIEKSADVIALINPTGKILYMSSSVKRVLGYSADEYIGKIGFTLLYPDDIPFVTKQLAQLTVKPDSSTRFEVRIKHKDKSWVWIDATLTNQLTDKNINAIVVNFRDITKRKETEEKLIQNQERSTLAQEVANIGTYEWNIKTNEIIWTKELEKIYGFKEREFVTEYAAIEALNHPQDRKRTAKEVANAVKRKKDLNMEYRIITKSGEVRWLLAKGKFMKDNKGNLEKLIGIVQDITQRKNSENEIKRAAAIIESSEDAIIGLNPKSIITNWNAGAEKLYGYRAKEIIGKPSLLLMPPNKKDDFPKIMNQLLQGKRIDHYETQRITKNGEILNVAIGISPIKDDNGNVIGASKIVRNITEKMQFEENLLFLSEASKTLSSSLDYQTTLNKVAQLAIPHIADWCGIDMITDTGEIKQVAVTHKDPKQIKWAREYRKANPVDMSSDNATVMVIKTKQPQIYPVITDEMLVQAAKNKKELDLARKLKLTSVIIVPIIVDSQAIGVISFITTESRRRYTEADLAMAEELASRAALAITNAKLYTEAQKEIENRKITQEALRASEQRYRLVVENTNDIISLTNTEGNLLYTSPSVERVLGYTPAEMLKLNVFSLVHPEDLLTAKKGMEHATKGNVTTISYRYHHKNGTWLYLETTGTVLKDPQYEKPILIFASRDITQRKELEMRKDEFISMASHELKTPVTSLKMFTEILLKQLQKYHDEKANYFISKMQDQTDKLKELINDLLDISRIQTGKLQLQKDNFSINELINDTVESMQAITKKHRIFLKETKKFTVHADEFRIYQVLTNLITNSIKYSPKGGDIIVSIQQQKSMAIISVKDEGIGIEKSELTKIFERLYQVTSAEEKTFPGLGMGLYISKEIIQRHNGEIWVESKKGKGATFFFSLPIVKVKQLEKENDVQTKYATKEIQDILQVTE